MQNLPTEISGMIYDSGKRRFLAHVRLHEPDGAVDYRLELPGPVTMGYQEAATELATLARTRHQHGLRQRSVPRGLLPKHLVAAA